MAADDRQLLEELRRLEALEARASGQQPPTTSTSPSAPQQGRDVGLGEFALEGATFGFAPKITSALAAGALAPFMDETFGQLYNEAMQRTEAGKRQYEQQNPVLATVGRIAGALPTAAGIAGTAPARALGNLAGRFGTAGRIGAGALAGEASQRVYEAGTGETGKELETLGREGVSLGGVLGGAIPAVGAGLGSLKRAFTPKLNEGMKPIVDLAKKYKIPLGLDDLTDSKFYQQVIQKGGQLPFSGAGSKAEAQLSAFTRAVAKSVGLDDVDQLTPANMDKAFSRVGAKFDDLTSGKTFAVSNSMYDDLGALDEAVQSGTYGSEGQKLFNKYFNDLISSVKEEKIAGESLKNLRNKFARISRTGTNPEAKTLAKDFENILIDLIGEDAPEALRQAKYQYKNLIAIEPLAQKVQAEGFISPARLTNRVASVYKRDFTRGRAGELGDLALLGQVIKQKVPDSGTPIGNVVVGGLTGGSVPLAFISPTAAAAQVGLGGLGIGANRLLQSRNVNPRILQQSIGNNLPATINPNIALRRGAQTGATLGALTGEQ